MVEIQQFCLKSKRDGVSSPWACGVVPGLGTHGERVCGHLAAGDCAVGYQCPRRPLFPGTPRDLVSKGWLCFCSACVDNGQRWSFG